MSWSRRFDDPIPLKSGRVINTLADAREAISARHPAQAELAKAAEHPAFLFTARIAAANALHDRMVSSAPKKRATRKGASYAENRKAWIAAGRPKTQK